MPKGAVRWVAVVVWGLASAGARAGEDLPPKWSAAATEMREALLAYGSEHLRANDQDGTAWSSEKADFYSDAYGSARFPGVSGKVSGFLKDVIHVPQAGIPPNRLSSKASLRLQRYNTDEAPYSDEEFRVRCKKNRYALQAAPLELRPGDRACFLVRNASDDSKGEVELRVQRGKWEVEASMSRDRVFWAESTGRLAMATKDAVEAVTFGLALADRLESMLEGTGIPNWPTPPLPPATALDVGGTDAFLNACAATLRYAATGRTEGLPPVVTPGPEGERPSRGQGAALAGAVWDQVRGLVRFHIENPSLGLLQDRHKKRIRIFGHYVAWLLDVERSEPWVRAIAGSAGSPVGPSGEGRPGPTWPLFGETAETVPPPPIREISDAPDLLLALPEYAIEALRTIAMAGDAWFTRGAFTTLYACWKLGSGWPTAIWAACNAPYVGPLFVLAYCLYTLAVHGDEMTYADCVAQLCTLVNLALGAHANLRVRPPLAFGDPGKGVWEGGVPKSVTDALGRGPDGKPVSFRLTQKPGSNDVATLEYALAGPLKGIQGGKPGEASKVLEREVRVVEHEGKQRLFDARTGEPIIPHDTEGYHAWSHLVERKCGHDTGYTPLRQALAGTPYEAEVLSLITAFKVPTADRQALNVRYSALMSRLKSDFGVTGGSAWVQDLEAGWYHFGTFKLTREHLTKIATQAPEANYWLTVRNARGEVNLLRLAYNDQGKLFNVLVTDPTVKTGAGLTRTFMDTSRTLDRRLILAPVIRSLEFTDSR